MASQKPREEFSRRGLAQPGASPWWSAYLGSTSSCLGPATSCQDRHTCTWERGWRSGEQEGTGTHSRHWAGHSARRHLQLTAQRERETERVLERSKNKTCQVLPSPEDEALPSRHGPKTFSPTFIGHLPAL